MLHSTDSINADLSDEERAELISIKNKILSLDQKQTRQAYSGLVELIYSYNLVYRTFDGDLDPESSWLIGKISPMLSWVNQDSLISIS